MSLSNSNNLKHHECEYIIIEICIINGSLSYLVNINDAEAFNEDIDDNITFDETTNDLDEEIDEVNNLGTMCYL